MTDVPRQVREEVRVEDDGGENRRERPENPDGSEKREGADERSPEQDVTEQPPEGPDFALREDPPLAEDGEGRRPKNGPERAPLARVEPGENEVIEVDQRPHGAGVRGGDRRVRERETGDEGDGSADGDRDREVVLRVDAASPTHPDTNQSP